QLPISKDSTLEWIGFSDKGLPAMYDSEGVLSILHRHRQYHQARWIPVLYTRNNPNPDDEASYYWPVGLNENKFLCIACKDGERMPRYPRQKFHEFDWQIPLLNLDKPIGKTEEVYARMNLLIKFECDEIRAKKKSIDINNNNYYNDNNDGDMINKMMCEINGEKYYNGIKVPPLGARIIPLERQMEISKELSEKHNYYQYYDNRSD
ncbi:19611_t:CDS:2, partial [Entrophospora sp. SA101]